MYCGPRPGGPRGVSCGLPESNAEALVILNNYHPGYWWDHTNLLESTDLMGYGWPDLGEPVLSDCDLDALAFVFAWALEGGEPQPRPKIPTTARWTDADRMSEPAAQVQEQASRLRTPSPIAAVRPDPGG